jgi:hypothetical protein
MRPIALRASPTTPDDGARIRRSRTRNAIENRPKIRELQSGAKRPGDIEKAGGIFFRNIEKKAAARLGGSCTEAAVNLRARESFFFFCSFLPTHRRGVFHALYSCRKGQTGRARVLSRQHSWLHSWLRSSSPLSMAQTASIQICQNSNLKANQTKGLLSSFQKLNSTQFRF